METPVYCMVLVTAPDAKVGERIARVLLEEKLVACANIVDGIRSMYWWNEAIETAPECLLMLKTLEAHVPRIGMRVKKLHPYKVPEVVSFRIGKGNSDYFEWIKASVLPG